MALKYLEQNKNALIHFKTDMNTMYMRDAFEQSPNEAINYLRTICKFVCANCGKPRITTPILKFYNYEADALCYDCQKLNLSL